VVDPGTEFIQRSPVDEDPEASPPQSFWYYCQSRGGYYPKVRTCPEQWVKVPPRSG